MANIELDVSELVGFRDKLLEDYNREQIFYKLASELMEMVREVAKQKTPVDTGNLRKSWSTDNSQDKLGNSTGMSNNLMLEVSRKGNVYTVSIENRAYNARGGKNEENRYYASFVETGVPSRGIKGRFMMKAGEEAAEANAQKKLNEIVREWWRWVNG